MSMRRHLGLAMMMMMLAAHDRGRGVSFRKTVDRNDPDVRDRIKKVYGENRDEHEFNINGEIIMAHDRRTAKKIYANRHKKK